MKFLFRTDASSEIGTGHIMRCLAFGQMLKDSGNEVFFLSQTTNQNVLAKLRKENFKIFINEKTELIEDAIKTVNIAKENYIDWIITDGYKFNTSYQQVIINNNFNLLCIDDLAEIHFLSNIILNQNFNAEKIFNYSCENYTKLFLGIDNVLLRREFRREKKWERIFNKECKNVLITMGGSDPDNCTIIILRAIEGIKEILNLKVILGPSYNFLSSIKEFKNKSRHNIEILIDVDNMVPEIKWADLAIAAAGTTTWELAYLQTPTIIGITAENQKFVARELENEKLAENLGWIKNLDIPLLTEKISNVILYENNRKFLFEQIKKIKNKIRPESIIEFIFNYNLEEH